jgi:hypothetical protein
MTAVAFEYQGDGPKVISRQDINRELSRYIFCIGDHIEPKDKRAFQSQAGHMGGIWISPNEFDGAPCLRRTNYMAIRAGICPLENVSLQKRADHISASKSDEQFLSGKNVPAGARGYIRYAGEDANFLGNNRFRDLGLVEIPTLVGVEWSTGLVRALNLHFFPDYDNWLQRREKIPVLISDMETLIQAGMRGALNETQEQVGEAMLESATLFRSYASQQIEKNRQIIMSLRSKDTGGMVFGWTNKVRLFADQLGVKLEDESNLRGSDSSSTEVIELMKADQELRLQEIVEQRRLNQMLMLKLGLTDEAAPEPEVIEINTPVLPLEFVHEVDGADETIEVEEIVEEVVEDTPPTLLPKEESVELPTCTYSRKNKRCEQVAEDGSEFCADHQ